MLEISSTDTRCLSSALSSDSLLALWNTEKRLCPGSALCTWPLPARGRFDLDLNVKQSICDRACFPPLLLLCQPDSWAQRGSWQETLTLSATQNHLNPIDPPWNHLPSVTNTHISVVPATFFSFAFFPVFCLFYYATLQPLHLHSSITETYFYSIRHHLSLFSPQNLIILKYWFFWVAISNICVSYFPSLHPSLCWYYNDWASSCLKQSFWWWRKCQKTQAISN